MQRSLHMPSVSKELRVLVISKEAWRDEQNGGNVLSNIFGPLDAQFAQVYCTDALPNNAICQRYFQITDRMMLNSLLHGTKAGKVLEYAEPPHAPISKEEFSSAKGRGLESIRVARELLWSIGRIDYEALAAFIDWLNPNVVFAPCYGNHYMLAITRWVATRYRVPIVSYISDDFYTNRQLRLSLLYWANHFLLRRHVRQTFTLYDLVYTMTDEQKTQCERDFRANMKILRKGGSFEEGLEKKRVNKPICLVYAGGIYLNRWKTLSHLAKAIAAVNGGEQRFRLDVYTSSQITPEIQRQLEVPGVSQLHKAVSSSELKAIYAQADIALHVEGFDLANRFKVRMSFSTKIVDCLDSGCAVMAICDPSQAGFAYLRRNDAAICIGDLDSLEPALERIASTPELLIEYQAKAFDLGRKSHDQRHITEEIERDFERLAFGAQR